MTTTEQTSAAHNAAPAPQGYYVPGPAHYYDQTPPDGTPVLRLRPAVPPGGEVVPDTPPTAVKQIVEKIPDRPGVGDEPTLAFRVEDHFPNTGGALVPWVENPHRVAGLPGPRFGDIVLASPVSPTPAIELVQSGLSLFEKMEALAVIREQQEAAENAAQITRLREQLDAHAERTFEAVLERAADALGTLVRHTDPDLPILNAVVEVAVGDAEPLAPAPQTPAIGRAAVRGATATEDRTLTDIERVVAGSNTVTHDLGDLPQQLADLARGPQPPAAPSSDLAKKAPARPPSPFFTPGARVPSLAELAEQRAAQIVEAAEVGHHVGQFVQTDKALAKLHARRDALRQQVEDAADGAMREALEYKLDATIKEIQEVGSLKRFQQEHEEDAQGPSDDTLERVLAGLRKL